MITAGFYSGEPKNAPKNVKYKLKASLKEIFLCGLAHPFVESLNYLSFMRDWQLTKQCIKMICIIKIWIPFIEGHHEAKIHNYHQ